MFYVMKKFLIIFIFSFFSIYSGAQEITYSFRLLLKDKGNPGYTIDKPEQFLSSKAIERRDKQGIAIDSTDFPIDPAYINAIKQTGVTIAAQSKWVKTITVHTKDSSVVKQLSTLTFVDTTLLVRKGVMFPMPTDSVRAINTPITPEPDVYGQAFTQIHMHNGELLHNEGFTGKGMTIAMIDGGFRNADCIDRIDFSKIAEIKSFSHAGIDPLRSSSEHGLRGLSCMLANEPGVMVGTAPEATFYLFSTEFDAEEYPVEEDYWITAIEYADSLGIDIATTSLGYTTFDNLPEMNHTQTELDGKTVLMSRAASMAVDKGMFLLNAAGNEGNKTWMKISFPADANNVLTVGSVQSDGAISSFSGIGPSADGRTKPDAMALGSLTTLTTASGSITRSNGTSYATPILAGLTACLWQSHPELTSKELLQLIQKSSDRYGTADDLYGFGIPDIYKAYQSISTSIIKKKIATPTIFLTQNILQINLSEEAILSGDLILYNPTGIIIKKIHLSGNRKIDLNDLPKGIYIAKLQTQANIESIKFVIL